jgi:hypothetical protein
LNHRAAVLADFLTRKWGVEGKLAELPDLPIWSINATCFETGWNWRFLKREMGDWPFGRHSRPPFSIAEVAASSAAVPNVIGGADGRLGDRSVGAIAAGEGAASLASGPTLGRGSSRELWP